MVKPEFLEEKPLTMAEVAAEIKDIERRDTELDFRSNKTKEYLEMVEIISEDKAKKLKKKIEELNFTRLKEVHIVKLIDLLPQTADEVKVILQAYSLNLSKKDMESLAEAIKEFKK
ncbi:hypothetical protein J4417_04980 [Candidatus Woesearchaeota archaeon]|nr:hypothetical protein [Candidatus Woesearchaeota archaeon]